MEVLNRVRMMQRAEELLVVFLRKIMPSWGGGGNSVRLSGGLCVCDLYECMKTSSFLRAFAVTLVGSIPQNGCNYSVGSYMVYW